jgi:hypothetical protein
VVCGTEIRLRGGLGKINQSSPDDPGSIHPYLVNACIFEKEALVFFHVG